MIRNMSNTPVVEIGAHPVSSLDHDRSHKRDVDHIAFDLANLDSVSYRVQLRPTDRHPPRKTCDHILQRHHQPGTRHPECKAYPAQTICEKNGDEDDDDDISGKNDELADPVACVALMKMIRQSPFEQLKYGVNEDNPENATQELRPERKRTNLLHEM